jgi:hypothetical protein
VSAVEAIDVLLQVYSEDNGSKLFDENAEGQGEKAPAFGITGPADIYVCVSAKNKKINQNDFYELKISSGEYESRFELEPNDTQKKASELSQEKTGAELSSPTDVDYFVIKNTNDFPQQLSIEIFPDSDFDIQAEIFSDLYKKGLRFNDAKGDSPEGISNFSIAAGSHAYLKISAADKISAGSHAYHIKNGNFSRDRHC